MELREILARRRMHRSFETEPIPREQIERIAGVIRRAPSGGFSQGGSIVVVTDGRKRHEIADAGLGLVGRPGPAPPAGSRLRERQRPRDALVHWERW
jgi:nitroreductase